MFEKMLWARFWDRLNAHLLVVDGQLLGVEGLPPDVQLRLQGARHLVALAREGDPRLLDELLGER